MILKPNEITESVIHLGEVKANRAPFITMLLGIAAGIFIGLGGFATYVMYTKTIDPGFGKFLAGTVFVIAVMFVIFAGGELFTGNNLMTIGWAKKKYGFGKVAINWTAVLIGNFIGCVFIAFLAAQSGLLGSIGSLNEIGEKAIAIAESKNNIPFMQAVVRGVLCNLLVAGAIWMQTSSKDVVGKIFLLYFPIVAFVVSGYEHVVANMFYIPMGILIGADVTWGSMFANNLLPVAIGNTIGGGLILPALYYMIYVAPKKA